MRLAAIKREEEVIRDELERLNGEKLRHIRLVKRLRDEGESRFGATASCNMLAKRYALMNMLGKGGFSEVFKVGGMSNGRLLAG